MLIADDLGHGDIGFAGARDVRTPALDRLAAGGMRLTSFYAAAPNCSPSRTSLLTGRMPTRTGMYSYIAEGGAMHLPRREVTVAQLLRQAGYATCHLGKWHLAPEMPSQAFPGPADFGFDHSFGTRSNAKPSHRDPVNFVRNGVEVGPLNGYACDLVVDEGLRWLDDLRQRKPSKPFFLYVAFHEPHEKTAAPPELVAHHQAASDPDPKSTKLLPSYLGSIENMDQAIGRLLNRLDRMGMAKDTLVLFYSDNGSPHASRNAPFRGVKSELWEGGIRSAAAVRWPGRIPAGAASAVPMGGVDLLPTLASLAGYRVPDDRPIDGADVWPVWSGSAKTMERRTPLFWFFYHSDPSLAVRDGDWKLVAWLANRPERWNHAFDSAGMNHIRRAAIERVALYNLAKDPREERDCSAEEPQRTTAMRAELSRLHVAAVAEGPDWNDRANRPAKPKKNAEKEETE